MSDYRVSRPGQRQTLAAAIRNTRRRQRVAQIQVAVSRVARYGDGSIGALWLWPMPPRKRDSFNGPVDASTATTGAYLPDVRLSSLAVATIPIKEYKQ